MSDYNWLEDLGALQYMQLLQELHKRGYQRLRWFSYMAPNGCALRCIITIQDNIRANREVIKLDENICWWRSTSQPDSGNDGARYADFFCNDFPRLLEAGHGTDPLYAVWFDGVVEQAKAGKFPEYDGEFYDAPLGTIKVGGSLYPCPPMSLRLISWNIDGIKAKFEALKKLVADYDPDILCLQKVKDAKCSKEFDLPHYRRLNSVAAYAGVTNYIKDTLPYSPTPQTDDAVLAGHFLPTEFRYPHFTLFNIYMPYSNPSVPGAVEHRKMFDRALYEIVKDTSDRIIICGDMNIVAGREDCWDGKFERNQANFHAWERESFNNLIRDNRLVDTYRTFHPHGNDFTYFFQNNPKVRAANQGHRIDYILASQSFVPQITKAEVIQDITASTNNPILLEFNY